MYRALTICLVCLLTLTHLQGLAQREVVDINADWEFKRASIDSAGRLASINLPHTYNAGDAFDDVKGYYRGKATYHKELNTASLDREMKHYVRFGAANQHARVFVNSQFVGEHRGGYTAFVFDISDYLTFDGDAITVEVDNSHDPDIAPLKGDFTFYGGIYRDVELISVEPAHFPFDQYGSPGIFIDPLSVTEQMAALRIRGSASGMNSATHSILVSIYHMDGTRAPSNSPADISFDEGAWSTTLEIPEPELWSVNTPYLYDVRCTVIDKITGFVSDEVRIPYGIRYFSFDADQGFFLNGEHVKLMGVNRHQDRPGKGNALTTADHVEDMALIKQMGANFLRTAHYPQDPLILEICDRSGIVVSMEIPLDHEITQSDAFADNCKTMMLEMIHQYYNHPSIVIWAYMNEMGLWRRLPRDSMHMVEIAALARELEDLTRAADPYRYTMIPNHGQLDIYHDFGLTDIPMIVGWNLYYGWYVEDMKGFGRFVDRAHHMVPDKPMIITEYGAGADPRLTSFVPERFDFTLDWTLLFHQSHIEQIVERPFVAGSAVWNMFDFGSESRQDAVPHVNNKGLCGFDREPKPVFHLYRATLTDETVIEISDLPTEILLPHDGTVTIPIHIITNKQILPVNTGEEYTAYEVEGNIARIDWEVTSGTNTMYLPNGNTVVVEGITADKYWAQHDILRINFGTSFYYQPDDGSAIWFPDSGIPGNMMELSSGERFVPRNRGVGTDRAIAGSKDDPVYQTMIEGVERMSIALPPGRYQVDLYLARLDREDFNCQEITLQEIKVELCGLRAFTAHPISKTVDVNGALVLQLSAQEQKTYLNGIQITRK